MTKILLAAAVWAALLIAKSPVDRVNRTPGGVAAKGYDVVAYFEDGRPVKGSSRFTYEWMGANWQFSTGERRDRFAAAPDKYAPQYGGYCAWAVGHNYTADVDPEAWRIVDGKLYLNYSKSVQSKWEQDRTKWIREADRNWMGLHR
jgi:hypothetical protein